MIEKKYSNAIKLRCDALLAQGVSLVEISEATGVNINTLRFWSMNKNPDKRNFALEEVRKKRRLGMSVQNISKEYGLELDNVHQMLKGVKLTVIRSDGSICSMSSEWCEEWENECRRLNPRAWRGRR